MPEAVECGPRVWTTETRWSASSLDHEDAKDREDTKREEHEAVAARLWLIRCRNPPH